MLKVLRGWRNITILGFGLLVLGVCDWYVMLVVGLLILDLICDF